ncbi:Molecular chaperone IbpA, HSP20 family [Desulfonauticus submarinus]|uniref:Molecular chaperone IbpA, HSP20 family n=1 Tax=Desulfonauticus submarinus TaxID=206665 RepID=A0A1H0CSN4_9BACT|nr:Hsp20/alpha crystallin family protein [Desulfonauticus submarinus]SDN60920.1 Molecular chaperone IbpA, HSP20 family [Desulfonauticus submarinus]
MTQAINKKEQTKEIVFSPYTDIVEKEEGFYILMDIPGVDKQNLDLDLKENELEIKAKVTWDKPEKAKDIHVEFVPGEFRRQFTISEIVDKDKIKAHLKNGVLSLFLPKAEKAKPRKISITAE